jgi:hypothetical protein
MAMLGLAACSSSPPPTMDDVHKMIAEDRSFDALATLIPMAQAGDPAAQYELAGFYHYGYVGAADFTKAMKWYRASARQGYADAMVGMAVLYLGGQGVKQDRREAYVWLNLATEYMTDKLGVRKIKAIRDEIGRTLTPDDITFAKVESMMLQPTSSSVQPNYAESIEHLPSEAPAAAAPTGTAPSGTAPAAMSPIVAPAPSPATAPASTTPSSGSGAEPLQNVPPDTAPVPQATTAPVTLPKTTLPVTTNPATTPSIMAKPGIPSTSATGGTSYPVQVPLTPPAPPAAQ